MAVCGLGGVGDSAWAGRGTRAVVVGRARLRLRRGPSGVESGSDSSGVVRWRARISRPLWQAAGRTAAAKRQATHRRRRRAPLLRAAVVRQP